MNRSLLDQLHAQAFDRYLALWLAPPVARDFLLALFSLEQELLALPGKVSNPTLGVMRVTWWRDALLALAQKSAPTNPILQALEPYKDKAALLADYAETFDAVFYEEDKEQRIAQRADMLAALLTDFFPHDLPALRQGALVLYNDVGNAPAVPPFMAFLTDSRKVTRLGLIWRAIKYAYLFRKKRIS